MTGPPGPPAPTGTTPPRSDTSPNSHAPATPPRQPGKTAAEMRADQEAWRDSQPVDHRAGLYCDWQHVGTVEEGRDRARAHRADDHPDLVGRRTIRKKPVSRLGEKPDDAEIEDARRRRWARENAAVLERIAAIDGGQNA